MSSEDGWTRIPGKKGRKQQTDPSSHTDSWQIDTDATVSSLRVQFTARMSSWLRSDARKQLIRILLLVGIHDGPHITKAICLALSSFNRINLNNRSRSLAQLAVFYDVAEHLRKTDGEFTMLAQDPSFTAVDKEFLDSLGIKVLDFTHDDLHAGPDESLQLGPVAEYFGPDTFVAEFFMEHCYETPGRFLKCDLGLLIGTTLSMVNSVLASHPDNDRVLEARDLLSSRYRWYKFPDYGDSAKPLETLHVFGVKPIQEREEESERTNELNAATLGKLSIA